MIKRTLVNSINSKLSDNKVVIILGARQVGKTTLLENIFRSKKTKWLTGDRQEDISLLDENNIDGFIKGILNDYDYLVIDEAQRISNIGLKLKIIFDTYKTKIKVIATGSSSFDLSNKINEPLTGRKWEYNLFPLSYAEMAMDTSQKKELNALPKRLLYGYYPEVVKANKNEKELLFELTTGALYKDIFSISNIKKSSVLEGITKALAYQIGNQVSYTEIASMLSIDKRTVSDYINLLEQAFIVFKVPSFSSNMRNELKNSKKYYFYDVGIRNAVINDFTDINKRKDIGNLFENFCMAELKKNYNSSELYFWRDKFGNEIDAILKTNQKVVAYEIKFSEKRRAVFPNSFIKKYMPATTKTLTKENFFEVLV